MSKPIEFSRHALEQMHERGATEEEVTIAIERGEISPAHRGRLAFRFNFAYNRLWGVREYSTKQVMPIVAEEADRRVVITVYVFYF